MQAEGISKSMDVSLSRACNYSCSYCNQRQELDRPMFDMSEAKRKVVSNDRRSGKEWIEGLNAFPFRDEYDRLIFSGGEPSLHPDFFDIVSQVKGFRCKMIVTNLTFDVDRLIDACRAERTKVLVQPSFHFEYAEFEEFATKVTKLRAAGLLSNFIPVSIVHLPGRPEPETYRERFRQRGFDASLYRHEGYYQGEFRYAPRSGFGGVSQVREVLYSSCLHPVKPNGDIVYCTTDTYSESSVAYGNVCDKKFVEIPREILCKDYGHRHVSAAAWVSVRDPVTRELLWQGKNYRRRTPSFRLRRHLEEKNYRWLSTAKRVANRLQNVLRKESEETQVNLA